MTSITFTELVGSTLVTSHTDAIIVADLGGVIRFWNPGAEQRFGHPAEHAEGQSLDIIIPERLRERHWQGFHHWVATRRGRHLPGEILSVPAIHRDGRRLPIAFTITPLAEADGTVTALIAVLHRRDTNQHSATEPESEIEHDRSGRV